MMRHRSSPRIVRTRIDLSIRIDACPRVCYRSLQSLRSFVYWTCAACATAGFREKAHQGSITQGPAARCVRALWPARGVPILTPPLLFQGEGRPTRAMRCAIDRQRDHLGRASSSLEMERTPTSDSKKAPLSRGYSCRRRVSPLRINIIGSSLVR